jgi:(p)ppGpp synthase/HD superfamily hydrolase
MQLVEKAKAYAIRCHRDANHRYDGHQYEVHLEMVYQYAQKHTVGLDPKLREAVLAAAWVHDAIEDARQTYNDVKQATNEQVAELAYALTNEKGRNRRERASVKYYAEMSLVPGARLLKACDRLANLDWSIRTGSRMFEMYRKEHQDFVEKVECEESRSACEELSRMIEITKA